MPRIHDTTIELNGTRKRMTPAEFTTWRESLRLSQRAAAAALGLHYNTIAIYESGERNGKPVTIPKTVALACAAIYHRLDPIGG